MFEPKISIIVPVYNAAAYIDSFFECFNKLQYYNVELLLIDDGSIDSSYEICCRYTETDKRVKVYKKENGGPGSARNYGIKKATGDYIVLFDIDDEFYGNILEDNVKLALRNDADIVMWNFKMIILDKDKELIRKIGSDFVGNADEYFQKYLISTLDNEMFNPPWNKLLKRTFLIDNNLLFNEEYSIYEDILFSYEVMKKAKKIAINDEVYYSYIIKESGSLLTSFHKECFDVILAIHSAAMDYGSLFENNLKQINRFHYQFIYLVKGYIKQICVNKKLTIREKKECLSVISENETYRSLCSKYDTKTRGAFARFMMMRKMHGSLVAYYRLLDFFRQLFFGK